MLHLSLLGNILTFFYITALKMKFSIKDFFSKCDQIRSKLRIWSYLLEKSLTENFIFCAVYCLSSFPVVANKITNPQQDKCTDDGVVADLLNLEQIC